MTTTSTTTPAVLAMDAGQTGARAQLTHAGMVLHSQEFDGVLTDRPVLPQLARIALAAVAAAPRRAEVLAVGSSGLTDDMQADALLGLVGEGGFGQVHLAHDSTTSYLGALGNVPGVVTAAGTGVVTLAVGERAVARVDGWGNLIGDAGSGYWIGRAALDAVMRAHDGRGPATALTPLAKVEFGDLEGAYMILQGDEHRVSRIAAWSRTVGELAAQGDEVCRAILTGAGQELALSACAGLERVGQAERPDPAVSTVGKVFSSPEVMQSFTDALLARHPGARLLPPRGTGLDGAALLPEVRADEALASRIRRA
ncbi:MULTISPECIES: N-acetylglucosamine kinase [unclassified Luteococcus]|uniref:N-acetylglucosamine kinase n=1 Tax=unclassified Luteococcus TaxID=2639923 RepID=UPI00313DE776